MLEESKEKDERLTACCNMRRSSPRAVTLSNEQSVSVFLSLFVCSPAYCHMPHISRSYCVHLRCTFYDLQHLGVATPLMLTSAGLGLLSCVSKCLFRWERPNLLNRSGLSLLLHNRLIADCDYCSSSPINQWVPRPINSQSNDGFSGGWVGKTLLRTEALHVHNNVYESPILK